jgi:predicted ATP-dependent endonuclease of OLD family
MKIAFVEVQNFRKLKSIRIDFSEKTTLFVGANNSGKTSAMLALRHFLVEPAAFTPNDITLSSWSSLETLGSQWETQSASANPTAPTMAAIRPFLPALDLWFEVRPDEVHYVRKLVPTLDWAGGALGVRLLFEPQKIAEFQQEYLKALKSAKATKKAALDKSGKSEDYTLKLWPHDMRSFLDRKLSNAFEVHAYLLDPQKLTGPANGIAKPQPLADDVEPEEGNPLDNLIRIDEISAQRGFGESGKSADDPDSPNARLSRDSRRLSGQLRSYYSRHLDPTKSPEPADLEALEAIEVSQRSFDTRLSERFSAALNELAGLNYPGLTDPRLTIATEFHPVDGLNHNAAVQYEVLSQDGTPSASSLRLPEEYNGLGYQNLISIVFKLMSFRDAWMRVGKASKDASVDSRPSSNFQPLHLVLIEEPEAHLHPQVQQVFVRQAYLVLRNHDELRDKPLFQTQLIVSTHSSHVAHECQFSALRYFRRLPATGKGDVPTSAVINLSEVFGPNDDTLKFVTRYLRAVHCDLLFADAAILVEGPAERMLVPHFIRGYFPKLNRSYVTILEIGGSHAHRFSPFIETLGLTTLIIADLDSVEATGHHKSAPTQRGANQLTANATLKQWLPVKSSIDELLNLPLDQKVRKYPMPLFSVRVAYQIPISVQLSKDASPQEALPTTFEDSLAFENLNIFKNLEGGSLAELFKTAIEQNQDTKALATALFTALETGDKAEFALDLLSSKTDPTELKVPKYIREGLEWLQIQLEIKDNILLTSSFPAAPGPTP